MQKKMDFQFCNWVNSMGGIQKFQEISNELIVGFGMPKASEADTQ